MFAQAASGKHEKLCQLQYKLNGSVHWKIESEDDNTFQKANENGITHIQDVHIHNF